MESPQELFKKCENVERVANREMYDRLLATIAGEMSFPKRLFEREPVLDEPSPNDSADLRVQRDILRGRRYQQLIAWLKEYRRKNERWILLAMWLRHEGVCDPWEFLPPELYEVLTREKRPRVSIADHQHYHRVEAWKPYFDRLLTDRRQAKKGNRNSKSELIKAGYDEGAIEAAERKRDPIPAACEWVAARNEKFDAPTLRNAHSRVSRTLAS